MSDDRAPRWLVRWLLVVLIVAVAGWIVYELYDEATWVDRAERQIQSR